MLTRIFHRSIPVKAENKTDFSHKMHTTIVEYLDEIADRSFTNKENTFVIYWDGLTVSLYKSDTSLMAKDLDVLPIRLNSKQKYRLVYQHGEFSINQGQGLISCVPGEKLNNSLDDLYYEIFLTSPFVDEEEL